MIKELDPASNVSDLVDYLLERGVIIHMIIPDDDKPAFEIIADRISSCGERVRYTKQIDLNTYKCAPPELRNMIVTQTIYTMVEELTFLR